MRRILLFVFAVLAGASPLYAAETLTSRDIDRLAQEVEAKVIAWRRDIHEHPELSNREFRTAKLVAEHLLKLGLEVKTGVAKTGARC